MRENWKVLMVVAALAVVTGALAVHSGIRTTRERQRLEKARQARCEQTRAAKHWGLCCILCGRPGVDEMPVQVGGKSPGHYVDQVWVCAEHRKLGAEPSRDRAMAQRGPAYFPLVAGGLGVLLGLALGTVLLLARRRWRLEDTY